MKRGGRLDVINSWRLSLIEIDASVKAFSKGFQRRLSEDIITIFELSTIDL